MALKHSQFSMLRYFQFYQHKYPPLGAMRYINRAMEVLCGSQNHEETQPQPSWRLPGRAHQQTCSTTLAEDAVNAIHLTWPALGIAMAYLSPPCPLSGNQPSWVLSRRRDSAPSLDSRQIQNKGYQRGKKFFCILPHHVPMQGLSRICASMLQVHHLDPSCLLYHVFFSGTLGFIRNSLLSVKQPLILQQVSALPQF